MKNTMRSLIALLLAVLMMGSLAVAAYAEEPEYTYADGQSYEADGSQTSVYTVQVSAGPYLEGAERTRQELLAAGLDGFLYQVDGSYRIMSGKFQNKDDACRYRDLIREKTKREKAYVTEVSLPDAAIEDFIASYKQDPLVANVSFNGWETPTGAFVDMTANEEETKTLYTVQYSAGVNFIAAEGRRDELTELGFDGYVLKLPGCYLVLAGAFENRDDALALRDQIRTETGRWGTGIRALELPASLLK